MRMSNLRETVIGSQRKWEYLATRPGASKENGRDPDPVGRLLLR